MKKLVIIQSGNSCLRKFNTATSRGASSRPNAFNGVSIFLKIKYWHEFLKEINEEKLVLNIDEAGFGRTCKE